MGAITSNPIRPKSSAGHCDGSETHRSTVWRGTGPPWLNGPPGAKGEPGVFTTGGAIRQAAFLASQTGSFPRVMHLPNADAKHRLHDSFGSHARAGKHSAKKNGIVEKSNRRRIGSPRETSQQ